MKIKGIYMMTMKKGGWKNKKDKKPKKVNEDKRNEIKRNLQKEKEKERKKKKEREKQKK